MPSTKALLTFAKFLAWTGVAAAIDAALANFGKIEMPVWAVPILAAALKALATYVATKRKEAEV